MAERYSKKDASRCLSLIADVVGKKVGYKMGEWHLDCNSIYGGCVIEEVMNEGGGVTQPAGPRRRKPSEFCSAVHFARDMIAAKRRRR